MPTPTLELSMAERSPAADSSWMRSGHSPEPVMFPCDSGPARNRLAPVAQATCVALGLRCDSKVHVRRRAIHAIKCHSRGQTHKASGPRIQRRSVSQQCSENCSSRILQPIAQPLAIAPAKAKPGTGLQNNLVLTFFVKSESVNSRQIDDD